MIRTGPGNRRGRSAGLAFLLGAALAAAAGFSGGASAQTLTTLHAFGGGDGAYPEAGLIADAAGNLYGTTYAGGAGGFGTVFELTATGSESVLHSFAGYPNDGANPQAGLIADAAGNLYGTTSAGGYEDLGTVFELRPTDNVCAPRSSLFEFAFSDGAQPYAGLIADAAGNLYGTTADGGSGYGTVFELTTTGNEPVLHSFAGYPTDGAFPRAGLIADASGNLYGTTAGGGGNGTVFELTPTGSETVLHSFAGYPIDGAYPEAGLIADAAGNLYGTTAGGGGGSNGTVFKLTPTGSETVLHSFGGSDGATPSAGLIADASGNLYGTTAAGGAGNVGTVFKLAGSGFVVAASFSGTPGKANCIGQSIASLAHTYGGIAAAAASLGYAGVTALQNAVAAYCGG